MIAKRLSEGQARTNRAPDGAAAPSRQQVRAAPAPELVVCSSFGVLWGSRIGG